MHFVQRNGTRAGGPVYLLIAHYSTISRQRVKHGRQRLLQLHTIRRRVDAPPRAVQHIRR